MARRRLQHNGPEQNRKGSSFKYRKVNPWIPFQSAEQPARSARLRRAALGGGRVRPADRGRARARRFPASATSWSRATCRDRVTWSTATGHCRAAPSAGARPRCSRSSCCGPRPAAAGRTRPSPACSWRPPRRTPAVACTGPAAPTRPGRAGPGPVRPALRRDCRCRRTPTGAPVAPVTLDEAAQAVQRLREPLRADRVDQPVCTTAVGLSSSMRSGGSSRTASGRAHLREAHRRVLDDRTARPRSDYPNRGRASGKQLPALARGLLGVLVNARLLA